MLKSIFISVLLLLFTVNAGFAEDPITSLMEKTISFFTPLDVKVSRVEDNKVFIRLDSKNLINENMRMEVFRGGEVFYHPITREVLGDFARPVGRIEIIEIGRMRAIGRVISGNINEGDRAKIARTKKKTLFYQHKSVDWFLGDSYYKKLLASDRFELVDSSMQKEDIKNLLNEAKTIDAEVMISLNIDSDKTAGFLKQRMFWVDNGKEITSDSIFISPDLRKAILEQEGIKIKTNDKPFYIYELTSNYEKLAIGDLNGDGDEEILFCGGKGVSVYNPAAKLHKLWEIPLFSVNKHIYIGVIDINRNGKDDVIVTFKNNDGEIISYIYELKGTDFKPIWTTEGFLRISDGELLLQYNSPGGGYKGSIYNIVWSDEYKSDPPIKINTNIYDFVNFYVKGEGMLTLAFNNENFLDLYNRQGVRKWRSHENPNRTFQDTKTSNSSIHNKNTYYLTDRLRVFQNMVVSIKRNKGDSSRLVYLWWDGSSMKENIVIDKINGSILDYKIYSGRVYILNELTLGAKAKRLLKGKNPLSKYLLLVYTI